MTTHQDSVTPPNPPLSPAAQAVLDAYQKPWLRTSDASAAKHSVHSVRLDAQESQKLRAAADQVVPEHPMVVPGGRSYESAWSATVQEDIRKKFLAIAAELEGQP